MYKKDNKIYIPTDIAVDNYFENVNNNAVIVSHILSSIDSWEAANSAVFLLAEVASDNVRAHEQLELRPVTKIDAADIAYSIWSREIEFQNNLSYKALKQEYKRLKNNNFYGSKSLQCVLTSYFVKEINNTPVWCFLLTSKLKYIYLLENKAPPQQEINIKQVRELILKDRYTRLSNNDNLTLLFLDALQYSHNRGFYDTSNLISPIYTPVRGEEALFSNCLCFKYCFNNISNITQETYFIENLIDYNPSTLMKLNKNTALRLEGFHEKYVVENTVCYCYQLKKPFKSRFLIIFYEKTNDYPYAIQFIDDISPLQNL